MSVDLPTKFWLLRETWSLHYSTCFGCGQRHYHAARVKPVLWALRCECGQFYAFYAD